MFILKDEKAIKIPGEYAMENKRRHLRHIVLTSPPSCLTCDNSEIQINISDISSSGIGINTKERLSEGDRLRLEIMIPGDDIPMFVVVEVMWTKKDKKISGSFFSGVRLIDIHTHDKKRLISYINANFLAQKNSPQNAGLVSR